MQDAAVGKKPTRLAKSEPYLKCAICKLAAEEIWSQVATAAAKEHHSKFGEMEITAIIEASCDPDDDKGEWIPFYDIVQNSTSSPLELVKQEDFGECRRECMTIAHSCRRIVEEHREDLSEMLYKHTRPSDPGRKRAEKSTLTQSKFVSRICKKMSKACPGKPVPEGFKHKDERWMPIIDNEGYKMRKMQHLLNQQAKEHGSQPVQFLDPMGSMFRMEDDEF